MHSGICINRSCSKVEALWRWTGMFDHVCCLYASLLCTSKVKTAKRTLLQADNLFQSSDKKVTYLAQKQIKILGLSEKKRIKLDTFSHFKITMIFHFILQFSKSVAPLSRILFSKLFLATNSQLFCVTESDIGQGSSNHTPPLYELLVSVL